MKRHMEFFVREVMGYEKDGTPIEGESIPAASINRHMYAEEWEYLSDNDIQEIYGVTAEEYFGKTTQKSDDTQVKG